MYVLKFKSLKVKRKYLKINFSILKNIILLGIPSGLAQLTVMAVQIVMNNTLGYYGGKSIYGSEIPLACAGIVSKVSSVFNSIIMGISQSCQPIFGYNYGAKNYKRIKETFKTASIIVTIISISAFLLFQIFPVQILNIFGSGNRLYYEFGSEYLRIYMFCMFLNGVQILSSNFFPAIGKAKEGVFISLSRQAFLQLPLIVILPLFLQINGIMLTGPISDGFAGILSILVVGREMKRICV